MSWHIPASGAVLFCVLSGLRLLGVGNSVFSFLFHQEVGRAARQLALPTFSPSHPGQDWEAGIPEDGCPNNRRGSSGQLKLCLLGQRLQQHQGLALPEARPFWEGDRPWGIRCSPVLRCFFSRITPEGLVSCLYLTYWYAKNKYGDYALRKNGLLELAWPEKVPEA